MIYRPTTDHSAQYTRQETRSPSLKSVSTIGESAFVKGDGVNQFTRCVLYAADSNRNKCKFQKILRDKNTLSFNRPMLTNCVILVLLFWLPRAEWSTGRARAKMAALPCLQLTPLLMQWLQ